ncbi:MAG: hypothetical protein CMJ83_14010 [Planctomycetes bacterium]|nr:hypothetical protein [Planctomycetota bacterium]
MGVLTWAVALLVGVVVELGLFALVVLYFPNRPFTWVLCLATFILSGVAATTTALTRGPVRADEAIGLGFGVVLVPIAIGSQDAACMFLATPFFCPFSILGAVVARVLMPIGTQDPCDVEYRMREPVTICGTETETESAR